MALDYAATRRDLALLAESTERIAALAVVGEWGRGQVSRSSDLGLLVVSPQPQELGEQLSWLTPLGRVWVWADGWTHGIPVKRVLLDGALGVTLVLMPVAPPELTQQATSMAATTLARGYDIVKDSCGLAGQLEALVAQAPGERPSQEEFAATVAMFFLTAVQAVKRLAAGEWISAKRLVDGSLKDLLVRMLGWQAKAVYSNRVDTYWGDRHLEDWADGRTLEELASTFATYDPDGIRKGLFATMDSFRLAAIGTAQRWGLEYPENADRKATVWVKTWV